MVEAGTREDRWVVAPQGWVKVNVDAGVNTGEGVGVGAVCRDDEGRVLWGMAWDWKKEWEPGVAEAVAVLEGLEEAKRKGHDKVVIESDCIQVIEALNRKKHGRNIFYLVVNDILSLASYFMSISWVYTHRANNSVFHALAHLFPRVVGKRVWSNRSELVPADPEPERTFRRRQNLLREIRREEVLSNLEPVLENFTFAEA
ncbi:uncharacterized protein LOC141629422 [Silene latifolia]|uniref:uncharacterized protein LOC141629422 n=1 Tax=Silene latifolia TaxID=37657 RepID=UPI003D76BBE0